MSNFGVCEVRSQLVVDSRLIAEELGIEHASLRKVIEKYSAKLKEFGRITVATETVTNAVDARNQEKFCFLNKNQATFLMTLSRNTRYTTVKQRAEELGYSEAQIGDGSALERFIRSRVEPAF